MFDLAKQHHEPETENDDQETAKIERFHPVIDVVIANNLAKFRLPNALGRDFGNLIIAAQLVMTDLVGAKYFASEKVAFALQDFFATADTRGGMLEMRRAEEGDEGAVDFEVGTETVVKDKEGPTPNGRRAIQERSPES